MYNYYELGYVHALEKLGMVEKDAGIRSAFGAVKSVFGGKGMPLVNPEVQALKGQAELAKLRAGITERSAQGPLSPRQMTKNESKYNKIHQRYGIENTPTGAPAAAPAAQAPIAGATAPVGNKSTAPVTQSPTTPPVKTDAAAAGKGKDPAKDPGQIQVANRPRRSGSCRCRRVRVFEEPGSNGRDRAASFRIRRRLLSQVYCPPNHQCNGF
jgi:hypothetical protein